MSLQNRVDPFGEIYESEARGMLMGNRGGRLHKDDKTLGARRWRSKSWICCETRFKARRRTVMSEGYTELFFLDEATALAAGHRPCFECRREDAIAFAEAWARGQNMDHAPRAPEMDSLLHRERIDRSQRPGRGKKTATAQLATLPMGAVASLWGESWLVADEWLLRWRFQGYDIAIARSKQLDLLDMEVLTPPSIISALKGGYRPLVDSCLF